MPLIEIAPGFFNKCQGSGNVFRGYPDHHIGEKIIAAEEDDERFDGLLQGMDIVIFDHPDYFTFCISIGIPVIHYGFVHRGIPFI